MPADIQRLIADNDASGIHGALNRDNINAVNADGYTPLYYACMKSCVEPSTISLLLQAGAGVDEKGTDDETPLYIAAFHHRVDVVKMLLDKGADANGVNGSLAETALHLAARLGYGEIVAMLIRGQANLNSRNARQETPLFAAAKAGRHETVGLLIEAGASTSIPNEDAETPLFVASQKGYKHVVIMLKSDPNDLRTAKTEADVELRMHPLPLMSSTEIMERAKVDMEFSNAVRRRSSVPVPAKQTAPLEIVDIRVPKPKVLTHDPLTGSYNGPCRSLEESVQEAPPIPAELKNRPPAKLPRIGGTSMVVGTGTDEGGREPLRIDQIPDDGVQYYVTPKT